MRSRAIVSYVVAVWVLATLVACGQKGTPHGLPKESREAKWLLQGIWVDEDAETVVFKMEGDSVYYPDSTSMTAAFMVAADTLYIGSSARYHIEKQTSHVLWFRSPGGELVKLVKDNGNVDDDIFDRSQPQVLTVTDVVKRDTVVFYGNSRYHLYIAVNPTRYKVVRHTLNSDGLDVENVYYDNIIHLSIFNGHEQIFSRDFRKSQYRQNLMANMLDELVLNNMEYVMTDSKGFHVNASLCVPGNASCYLVEHVIAFDGSLSTNLLEY